MSNVERLVSELVSEAEARHRENSSTYFDALHRIVAVCADNAGQGCRHDMALDYVRRIATNALPRR